MNTEYPHPVQEAVDELYWLHRQAEERQAKLTEQQQQFMAGSQAAFQQLSEQVEQMHQSVAQSQQLHQQIQTELHQANQRTRRSFRLMSVAGLC